MRIFVLVLLAAAACTTPDESNLDHITDYETWPSRSHAGPTAGHPGEWRNIFWNDVAGAYGGSGRYAEGSVIVKEIYDHDPAQGDAELLYLAVMRKSGDTDGGWVFTQIKDGDERYLELCWKSCHRQAPFDGAWRSYGLPTP